MSEKILINEEFVSLRGFIGDSLMTSTIPITLLNLYYEHSGSRYYLAKDNDILIEYMIGFGLIKSKKDTLPDLDLLEKDKNTGLIIIEDKNPLNDEEEHLRVVVKLRDTINKRNNPVYGLLVKRKNNRKNVDKI